MPTLTSSSSSSMASPVKYSTARGTIRSRMKWPISKSAARMASESSSWNQTVYSCISWTKWEATRAAPDSAFLYKWHRKCVSSLEGRRGTEIITNPLACQSLRFAFKMCQDAAGVSLWSNLNFVKIKSWENRLLPNSSSFASSITQY